MGDQIAVGLYPIRCGCNSSKEVPLVAVWLSGWWCTPSSYSDICSMVCEHYPKQQCVDQTEVRFSPKNHELFHRVVSCPHRHGTDGSGPCPYFSQH